MGGSALAAEGVELIADLRRTTSMGGVEVIAKLPRTLTAASAVLRLARRWQPAAALLVDLPEVNLPLGRRLRRLGVPTVGYVAPQLWAWRSGRASGLSESFDRLACVLPFEEAPLRRAGVEATFVGHPAAERRRLTRLEARRALGLGLDDLCLALLPGSRPAEVARLLPVMLEAASRLRRRRLLRVVLPLAPTVTLPRSIPGFVEVMEQERGTAPGAAVLAGADAAIVASGTATLEAALAGTPQIAVYRMARSSYALARLLVRTRFIALPNILLRRPVVLELLQGQVDADLLTSMTGGLLDDDRCAREQRRVSSELWDQLRGPGASRTVAEMLITMERA